MIALLGLACQAGGADSGQPCAVTWDGWADGFFTTWCQSCHSAQSEHRYGAPEGVDLETEADIATWAERIRVRVLEEETMPIGGGIPQDERTLLARYLECVP
jgi:uncharacterized membrane protein